MTSADLGRHAALGIGAFQILANGVLLLRGLTRLPGELAREGATARLGELLRTAWVYGMLGNLCLSVVLVLIAPALRDGQPLAWRIAAVIGLYYVTVGLAVYLFSPQRHSGFLTFSALGLLLWASLWASR